MKKYLRITLLIVIIISSCEKDDFCTQNPVTPNLVLRFYNKNKDSLSFLKNVERLSIIATQKKDSLFTNKTTDSIVIPLNSLTNMTTYVLKMNTKDGNKADNQIGTLIVKYIPKSEYVSRSCGYRVFFNNVQLENNTSWIDSLSTKTIMTINNQKSAHVKVFH